MAEILNNELLTDVTLGQLAGYISIFIIIISFLTLVIKKVIQLFTIWYNRKNHIISKDETIAGHSLQIEEINHKIDKLTSTLDEFICESRKDNQVILRDKIYDTYKQTLQQGYILEKDAKNLHYAIDRYKANGGNSYVCHEIEPRLREFKVYLDEEHAMKCLKK